jgi:hypothetical protein
MYKIAQIIFWLTLILYCATLMFASYVGVYLTYAAVPTIIFSGLVMWSTAPKEDVQKPKTTNAVTEGLKATTSILNDFNDFMGDVNTSLEQFNKKTALFNEKAIPYKAKIRKLENEKKLLDIHLRYAKIFEERMGFEKQIKPIKQAINEIEMQLSKIEKQCELEAAGYKD